MDEAWTALQEVIAIIGKDKIPVIEQIDLAHEIVEMRDGAGVGRGGFTELTGAVIRVRFI